MHIFKKYLSTCFLVALGTLANPAQAQTAAVTAYAVQDVTSRTGFFDATYTFKRSFGANDPVYPNKTDYVKKNVSIAKSGNPLNWVKNNALTVAVTAAVAAAGYAIDELTNQVMTVSQQGPDPMQVEGYYWKYLTLTAATPDAQIFKDRFSSDFCSGLDPATFYCEVTSVVGLNYNSGYGSYSQYRHTVARKFVSSGGTQATTIANVAIADCNGSTTGVCAPALVGLPPEPVPDAEVWTLVEPVFTANPTLLSDSLVDSLGNPYYFQEVADAADAIGAGVADYQNYSGAIVTEPVGDAPTVSSDTAPFELGDLDLPTDYAREETTQGLLQGVQDLVDFFNTDSVTDFTSDPNPDYLDSLFNPVQSDMENVADPTGDPTALLPALPSYSATCETLSYDMMGSTFTFPTSSQCDKLNTGKSIMSWFLYLVTAGLIINLFLSRTGRAVT